MTASTSWEDASASMADLEAPGRDTPNGVLIIDKPEGPTSHDVVARVRKAVGLERIGHTGTLDPLASGVLPLALGRATRLVQFLMGGDKEYEAVVRLGLATDTYDTSGTPVGPIATPESLASGPAAEVSAVLDDLKGWQWQQPPPFSAKKVGGKRAYALARRGQPVQLAPVRVFVEDLELLEATPGLIRLHITCSPGFYVRSLAHDIGVRLGVGACLQDLQRQRSGNFLLRDALSLATLERDPATACREALIPMSGLLPCMPAVTVTREGARRAARGNLLTPRHLTVPGLATVEAPPPPAPEGLGGPGDDRAARVRVLDEGGRLLAIAEPTADRNALHPRVVVV